MDAAVRIASRPAVAPMHCLSLPSLSQQIPRAYTLQGETKISSSMAIAMIEYGMIVDASFLPKDGTLVEILNPPDEKRLVEATLTSWWRRKTKPMSMFTWNLTIQCSDASMYRPNDDPWLAISANAFIPQRLLARPLQQLEKIHPGFGQTVLAVLYDAMEFIPIAWTPRSVLDFACYVYWHGCNDEEDYIANEIEFSEYASREDFLADNEVFKRADFFRNMPEWVTQPERVCSREILECAASSPLGKNVIAACDAIHAVVTSPTFTLSRYDVGTQDIERDSVEACVFLRWSERDIMPRIVDDALNEFSQGDCIQAIHARPIAPTPASLRKVLGDIEQMLLMASAVEKLLLLISKPAKESE